MQNRVRGKVIEFGDNVGPNVLIGRGYLVTVARSASSC